MVPITKVMACVDHFAPNLKRILQNRPQNLSIVYGSEFMKPKKNASDLCSEKAENVIIKFLQPLGPFGERRFENHFCQTVYGMFKGKFMKCEVGSKVAGFAMTPLHFS